ncbi:MAG: hypothetical protein ACLQVI_38625 [Polyangiaceae bacterium]
MKSQRGKFSRYAVPIALALLLTSARAHAGACVPGAQVACACPGGTSSVQVCTPDGAGLGPCDCSKAAPPAAAPIAPAAQQPSSATAAPAATSGEAPPPTAPAPTGTATPAAAGNYAPAPWTRPHAHEARRGHGLIVAGLVTLGVGYILAVIGGGVAAAVDGYQNSNTGTSCVPNNGWMFVPIVGPAITTGSYPNAIVIGTKGKYENCGSGAGGMVAFGVIDSVLQIGGALLLGTGVVMGATDHTRDSAPPTAGFSVKPGVAGNPLGLTASFSWF